MIGAYFVYGLRNMRYATYLKHTPVIWSFYDLEILKAVTL